VRLALPHFLCGAFTWPNGCDPPYVFWITLLAFIIDRLLLLLSKRRPSPGIILGRESL